MERVGKYNLLDTYKYVCKLWMNTYALVHAMQ